MEKVIRDLKDQSRDRITPRPDRTEVMDVLSQNGTADGFSLEWVVDRFPEIERGRS